MNLEQRKEEYKKLFSIMIYEIVYEIEDLTEKKAFMFLKEDDRFSKYILNIESGNLKNGFPLIDIEEDELLENITADIKEFKEEIIDKIEDIIILRYEDLEEKIRSYTIEYLMYHKAKVDENNIGMMTKAVIEYIETEEYVINYSTILYRTSKRFIEGNDFKGLRQIIYMKFIKDYFPIVDERVIKIRKELEALFEEIESKNMEHIPSSNYRDIKTEFENTNLVEQELINIKNKLSIYKIAS